jgi:hypothetical protein
VNAQVLIRTGEPRDAEVVLRLWREADAAPSTTDDDRAIRTLLARDPEALLLADADGEPVGKLIVGWDGWRGALYRQMQVRRVAAMVISDHDHAAAFWSAIGYEPDPGLGRFVRMLD